MDPKKPAEPTAIELAVAPDLAADPAVREALDKLSAALAEAEMLDDDEVSGFAARPYKTISLSQKSPGGIGVNGAGCIGFSMDSGGGSCGVHWTSCPTDYF